MNRRTARAAGLVALLMGAGTLVQPVHAAAPAPQNTCSGAFCVTFDLVASPVQHDEQQVPLAPAPEHGQHTEEILLELGLEWDEIARGKQSGAIL